MKSKFYFNLSWMNCILDTIPSNYLKLFSKILTFVFFIFICSFFICSSFSGDDVSYFAHQSITYNWLINERYLAWSSRIIIESVLPFLINHEILFKFINLVILFSSPFALYKLCFNKKIDFFIYSLIVTFLPYYEMATAGFAATVTNYYYPIIFALWILAFVYSSKKNSIFIVVLSAVLSI